MTVKLVSSRQTRPKLNLVSKDNPTLDHFARLEDHLKQFERSQAFLVGSNKMVLLAAFLSKEDTHVLVPNICIKIPSGMRPVLALIAEVLVRGISTNGRNLYVEQFPREDAQLLAHIGLKKLLFREGYLYQDAVTILEENGVKIIRVDV
jgi:hypothetical protein